MISYLSINEKKYKEYDRSCIYNYSGFKGVNGDFSERVLAEIISSRPPFMRGEIIPFSSVRESILPPRGFPNPMKNIVIPLCFKKDLILSTGFLDFSYGLIK